MAKDSPIIEKTEWRLASSGPEGIELMFSACQNATRSIDCEQFIFANDATGIRFLELFLEKLRAGVRVRLLCDMVGSFYLYSSDWPQKLRDAGAEVRFFRAISPWQIGKFTGWYMRTHRKILIIDGRLAVSGGLAISDIVKNWRDTTFSLAGTIARDFRSTFDRMWDSTDEESFFRFPRFKEYSSGFRITTNAPHLRQKFIYKSMLAAIRNAKISVCLTTPYFTPNHAFVQALRKAARRGISVRLLLPEKSDKRWVDRAARSYFARLLKSGVRIFEHSGDFLHAKTAVADSAWASAGSFNLDGQSFFWNYETNIESIDKGFVAEIGRQFEEDILNSREVNREEFLARPFYQKFLEWITLPFHRVM